MDTFESETDFTEQVLKVKDLRSKIKTLLYDLIVLGPSREKALCRTKLQEASMWLGMELRRLADDKSVYANGNDPTTAVVDPAEPEAPIVR